MGALDRLENFTVNSNNKGRSTAAITEADLLDAFQRAGFLMFDKNGQETELCKVLRTKGNHYIQAIAGSGKTTALVLKIIYDTIMGELLQAQQLDNGMTVKVMDRVFVGTFLKSGAEELQQKVVKTQASLGFGSAVQTGSQISFGTLHAEFKRALNAMGIQTPIGKQQTLSNLFRKAVMDTGIGRTDGRSLSNEDFLSIESVFTYFRGRLDSKRADHPDALDYGLTQSRLELLADNYKRLKESEGLMDFEDLQELLYKFCYITPNPNVIEFLSNRYNYMYLDEFQDTSQIQYALIRVYMQGVSKTAQPRKHGKITVVGDVQQCIYSFRGSDINVMYQEFDKDFDSTHNNLSYNRRCPSAVLDPVVPSIMKNRESKGITIRSHSQGGTFHCWSYKDEYAMLNDLENNVKQDLQKGHTVAVLCRTNYDGMTPALKLSLGATQSYSISNESMTLSSTLAKRLIYVTHIFSARGGNSLKSALSLFVPIAQQYGVTQLCTAMRQNNKLIWDIPIADIEYSCKTLAEYIEEWHTFRSVTDDIGVLKAIYWQLRDNVFGDQDTNYARSAIAIIDVLLYMLNNRSYANVAEFREDLSLVDEDMHSRIKANSAKITITTVHEFKGKEADCVYVWNDSRGVFPAPRANIKNADELDEERRVHYIACTRAREKSIIMCIENRPSMFVKEMACKIEKKK